MYILCVSGTAVFTYYNTLRDSFQGEVLRGLRFTRQTWASSALPPLAPRHAVLDISSEENAFPVLAVTPLDGPLRLQGEEPVEPAEADGPLRPAAGNAWYLGTTCFAWNRPGVPQESLVPELSPHARTAGAEEAASAEAEAVPAVTETAELLPTANDLGMDAGA